MNYNATMASGLTKFRVLVIPFLGVFSYFVVRTAWVGDDAYITFRSIENFIHGYGPVFNIGERVQTFTHPLWFLGQSAANLIAGLWRDNPLGNGRVYFLNVFGSIALSILALTIFTFKVASSTKNAILGMAILTSSKAFLDYSTSGLENPLTHLLLILFIAIYLANQENTQRRIFILALLASLGGLDRLDTLLFYLPVLTILFLQGPNRGKTFLTISLGFLPLILWELFSLFYYGAPFPNTAYAKINTGIPAPSLIRQGSFYYLNSLRLDPITLLTIFTMVIAALIGKNDKHKTLAAGVFLYLLYTLYIGGDFMSGRYFSAPLLVAVSLLSNAEFKSLKVYSLSLGMALIIGIAPIYVIPERNPSFGKDEGDHRIFIDENGIADERSVYSGMSLVRRLEKGAPKSKFAGDNWIFDPNAPVKVRLVGPLGLRAYALGPNVHVIDLNSLADPLMPRLPLYETDHWRIGHFRHIIPEGYEETLETGENRIVDENIARYYDKLVFVVRGDLWSWARVVEIWNLNTGKYDYLLENVKPPK